MALFRSVHHPVLIRGLADNPFKQPREMLRIFESEFVGNLADRLARVEHPFLGQVDQLHLDMFLCRPARLFFNQVTEIVGRKMQFPGTVSHRRQSDLLGPVRNEVFVEHVFETHQNIAVHFVARNELPFVETHTVIQQQFDVSHDELLAVFVNRMLQLDPDFMYSISYDFSFLV